MYINYVKKNENYLFVLEKICQKQGRLSDDESKWTDVHSGWTIRNIDFYTEEGFDEHVKCLK